MSEVAQPRRGHLFGYRQLIDEKLLDGLCSYIQKSGTLQPIAQMMDRIDCVERVKGWLQRLSPEFRAYLSGSMLLGCDIDNSDVDMIVVGPPLVNEETFIESFNIVLQLCFQIHPKISNRGAFKVLSAFDQAAKVDFTYIRLKVDIRSLPNEVSSEDLCQLCADENTAHLMRSFDFLHRLKAFVRQHPDKFQLLAKTIKRWAQGNEICGNIGSIPSIAWMILLVRVYKKYEHACILYILERFFLIYAHWTWESRPVVWTIKDGTDYNARRLSHCPMEVRLPYAPYSNITENVKEEKFNKMMSAFKNGFDFIKGARTGINANWNLFFNQNAH